MSLELFFFYGKYVKKNIKKAIYYLTLAANYDEPHSQLLLGIYYLDKRNGQIQINKATDLINQSSKNGNITAHFILGYLYYEGKYFEQDIVKSVHYYKEAASFENQFAKNNLGILYKNGFDNKIEKNIVFAKIYFEEAIKRNDFVAMYNLAHIYIFDEQTEDNKNKSIEYLIKSSEKLFSPSTQLLCIFLIKNLGNDIKKIKKELQKYTKDIFDLMNSFEQIISKNQLYNQEKAEEFYNMFKDIDFVYDIFLNVISTKCIFLQNTTSNFECDSYNITDDFYEGFGIFN